MNDMSKHNVKIKAIDNVTHDTLRIITERPGVYDFEPGQATSIAIDREGWRDKKRPFTFTSLPEDDHFEFIIKTYPDHDGTTDKLLEVKAGEYLILFGVFGAIKYKGEGVFLAGGAGVTPFISILRDLHKKDMIGNNKLIFGNKTEKDIILKDELEEMLGDNLINILSDEKKENYHHGLITEDFLKKQVDDFGGYFYLCGPPAMMMAVEGHLIDFKVKENQIVKEVF